MKRIICAFVFSLLAGAAQAQSTKAQLTTEINTNLASGQPITAAQLRTTLTDILNSIMPTAPVTSNGIPCWAGTTGLLKDCVNTIGLDTVTLGNAGAKTSFTSSLIGGDPAFDIQASSSGAFAEVCKPSPGAGKLCFLTLNGPTSGTGAGAFIQADYNGSLGWGIGNYSTISGGAFDLTTTVKSVNGLRFIVNGVGAGLMTLNGTGDLSASAAGQIAGTATNDNATAGNIGQYVEGTSDAQALTFTVTIASPAVVTEAGHGYTNTGVGIWVPTTSGALPTGLTASTTYYVIPSTVSGSTFQVATSVANAVAGTPVNTSGTQSGTHTGTASTAVTNSNPFVVAAIPLTAGDWDVSFTSDHVAANTTVVSILEASSSASASIDSSITAFVQTTTTFPTTGSSNVLIGPVRRVSLSGAATYSLVVLDFFTTSTMKAYGTIHARRMR